MTKTLLCYISLGFFLTELKKTVAVIR